MFEIDTLDDVMARRSAVPTPGLGKVVMSMMRNLNAVTSPPVLFCTRRRNDNTPFGAVGGFGVNVRSRFGTADAGRLLSRKGRARVEVRWMPLVLFCGPGAPNACGTPLMNVPCVSANMKSALLSFVSFGNPLARHVTPLKSHSLRKKLCSVVEPLTGGRFVPSRNRSQTPVVTPSLFRPKPTASNRVTVERLFTSAVLNKPTLRSLSMSAVSV